MGGRPGLVPALRRRDPDDAAIPLDGQHIAEGGVADLALSTAVDPEPGTLAELHRGVDHSAIRALRAQHHADHGSDDGWRGALRFALRLWLCTNAVPWPRPGLHDCPQRDHDTLRSIANSAVHHVSILWLARHVSAAVGAALVRRRGLQYFPAAPILPHDTNRTIRCRTHRWLIRAGDLLACDYAAGRAGAGNRGD